MSEGSGRGRADGGRLDRWRQRLFSGGRIRLLLVVFAVLMSLGSIWAITAPIASVPDEPSHLVKAAGVARGEPFGTPVLNDEGLTTYVYDVPEVYAEIGGLTCNAFAETRPITECLLVLDGRPAEIQTAVTGAGAYNPTYYFLVGWPALLSDGIAGIVMMRFASLVLASSALAAGLWALSWLRTGRFAVAVGLAAVTPSLLFYMGGVNPQAAEISLLFAFTAAYFVALRTRARGPLLLSLLAVMGVAGVLAVQTRNLAWVWLGLIVLLGLVAFGWRPVLGFFRRPPVLVTAGAVGVAIAVNLALLLSLDALEGATTFHGAGMSWMSATLLMIYRGFWYVRSTFANFGWGDTDSDWAGAVHVAVWGALAAAAVIVPTRARLRAAVLVGLAAVWFAPALIQSVTVSTYGIIWQGRYSMPLWMAFILLCAIAVAPAYRRMPEGSARRLAILAPVLLALAHLVSVFANLKRQYVGGEVAIRAYFAPEPGPGFYDMAPLLGIPGWLVVTALVSAVFALVLHALLRPAVPEVVGPRAH